MYRDQLRVMDTVIKAELSESVRVWNTRLRCTLTDRQPCFLSRSWIDDADLAGGPTHLEGYAFYVRSYFIFLDDSDREA